MTEHELPHIGGSWRNQLGSLMEIQVADDGRIEGTMESPVGGVTGRHPLTGYVEGAGHRGVIGFVVSWQPVGSITTWSGHYDTSTDVVDVNWLLTEGDFEENEWQATRVGHDVFHRVREDVELAGHGQASYPPATCLTA